MILKNSYVQLIFKILPHFLITLALLIIVGFNFSELKNQFGFSADISGQLWRALSAHWTHLSNNHYIFNLLGLIIITYIFEEELSLYDCLITPCLFALFISLSFYIFPPIGIYAGFSGILHGLWTLGALQADKSFKIIAICALCIKIIVELLFPSGFKYEFIISHTAHLSGITAAILYFMVKNIYKNITIKQQA